MAKEMQSVLIDTLEDAVDLINNNTEVIMSNITKLSKQNRRLKLLNVFAVGCGIYLIKKLSDRDEELYKLSVRIKKLENKEGE